MIGQTISHYKITAKLGEGGMGEVYLATDTTLDRPVALKFLPASLQKEPEARERLIREAKAASRLNHKNILTIYSVESSAGRDFLVMEYVEGRTLRDLLDSGEEIPTDKLLRIGLQICDGLTAAHKQGVIHRDIKPANILVAPEGQVKIADFGLAIWGGARQLTKEGTTVGTAAYMAPEQIQGKKSDPRSDLFSLGVVLYEMIARRRPFTGEHDAAISYAITNEIPEPLQRFKSGVHPGLEQVVARALEKDPATRYQSAADMLAELKRVRREIEGSQPSMLSRSMTTAPKRSSRLKYLVASSIVLAAAVVLLVLKPFKFDVSSDQKAAATDNSLAVLYFDNIADPSDSDKMAQMITSLLITGLSESQYLQVTSRQRLYDILSQLGKGDAKSVDHSTASQVAAKAGVRWMVTGEILQLSPRVILTTEVSEVGTGKLVTTQKISSEPGEDVFAVADRLGKAIRSNLSLPASAQAEQTAPVASVTTRSPEAYRHYIEGLDYSWRYYANDARASFEKALVLDSTFAMVYYQMSNLSDIQGNIEQKQRLEWIAKAEKYAGHASAKEQFYIKAGAHGLRNEPGLALADISVLLQQWPNEVEALWAKIIYSRSVGRDLDAIVAGERIVQINPQFADAYNQLAYTYARIDNTERSLWAINHYAELTPNDANPHDSRADLYAYSGDAQKAIGQYRAALQINPEFGSDIKLACMYLYSGDDMRADSIFQTLARSTDRVTRSKGRATLSVVDAYHGRFTKAAKILDDAIAADRMEGYDGAWYLGKLGNRMQLHAAKGEWDQAAELAKQLCSINKKLYPDDPEMSRGALAWCLAEGGKKHEAKLILDSLRATLLALSDTTGRTSEIDLLSAYSALMIENDPRSACASFERTYLFDRSVSDAYYFGKAYLELGELDKAIKTLERGLSYLTENQAYDSFYSVRCYHILGLTFEKLGQKDKAEQQYKTFLNIWKDADPGIPEIEDARTRLAKLST